VDPPPRIRYHEPGSASSSAINSASACVFVPPLSACVTRSLVSSRESEASGQVARCSFGRGAVRHDRRAGSRSHFAHCDHTARWPCLTLKAPVPTRRGGLRRRRLTLLLARREGSRSATGFAFAFSTCYRGCRPVGSGRLEERAVLASDGAAVHAQPSVAAIREREPEAARIDAVTLPLHQVATLGGAPGQAHGNGAAARQRSSPTAVVWRGADA
jgi:hypothetical protein